MKTITQRVITFIFILFCMTYATQANIPETYTNVITHRSSKNFLQRLYQQQWIGTNDVRPLISKVLTTLHDTTKTDTEKKEALNELKRTLYTMIGTVQHTPTWLTFEAIEKLEQNHVFCGFSSHEMKRILMWIAASSAVYLGKEYIRTQFNIIINSVNAAIWGPIARYIKNDLPKASEEVIAASMKRIIRETVTNPEFKANMKANLEEAIKTAVDEFSKDENQEKHKQHVKKLADGLKASFLGETPEEKKACDKRLQEIGKILT